MQCLILTRLTKKGWCDLGFRKRWYSNLSGPMMGLFRRWNRDLPVFYTRYCGRASDYFHKIWITRCELLSSICLCYFNTALIEAFNYIKWNKADLLSAEVQRLLSMNLPLEDFLLQEPYQRKMTNLLCF